MLAGFAADQCGSGRTRIVRVDRELIDVMKDVVAVVPFADRQVRGIEKAAFAPFALPALLAEVNVVIFPLQIPLEMRNELIEMPPPIPKRDENREFRLHSKPR